TAWLYMFWHGGFPIAVMTYAWLRDDGKRATAQTPEGSGRWAIIVGVATVLALTGFFIWLATPGSSLLPPLLQNHGYPVETTYLSKVLLVLSAGALVAVAWRRSYSVLDVWLMVVLCAWLCDVALSAALNGQRFDLGFYAGRVYGFMAAAFVLLMMQVE